MQLSIETYCTVELLRIAIYVAVRSLAIICSNTIKLLQLLNREGKSMSLVQG